MGTAADIIVMQNIKSRNLPVCTCNHRCRLGEKKCVSLFVGERQLLGKCICIADNIIPDGSDCCFGI